MKDIKGFEGSYACTKDGKIWSHPLEWKRRTKGKFLKSWLIGNGYESIMLYDKPEHGSKFLVHRLVALTYIPNPKNLTEVNHINGNRIDNRVENLEWMSSIENHRHAFKLGLYEKNIGSNHYLAKLNDMKVREIKNLLKKGIKQIEISRKYNVSPMTISNIFRGKVWNHVI